jgi:undecaprenyl-diphosphatase
LRKLHGGKIYHFAKELFSFGNDILLMLELLLELDQKAFFVLNGFNTPWLDQVMFWISKTEFWIPLYAGLLFLIIKNYKKKSWAIIGCLILTIILADQITSTGMKPFFQRVRPSRDPQLKELVHTVNGYKGGKYGFASSHAANTMGIAFFLWLLFANRYRWIWILFIWATIVSFSRIYLGVHYPGDILVGMLLGLLSGYLGFIIKQKFESGFKQYSLPDS